MTKTPNFTGWNAMILAEEDGNCERLKRQLHLLGMSVSMQWKPLAGEALPDPRFDLTTTLCKLRDLFSRH